MKEPRRPKTLVEKLNDLDSHLFLLREHRQGLSESRSHLKGMAAELRTLICLSTRTNEGLLWRLVDELKVDDRLFLHVPGQLRRDNPLAQGLKFYIVPIQRGGKGDPRLPPYNHSLNTLSKNVSVCTPVVAP